MIIMTDSENEKTTKAASLDASLYRLIAVRRELAYHKSVLKACEDGLDECLEIYDEFVDDAAFHMGLWSKRVSMASQATIVAMQNLAMETHRISELCHHSDEVQPPPPPPDKVN